MKITFKDITRAGNNLRAVMLFDGSFAATINCTPEEFSIFTQTLRAGVDMRTEHFGEANAGIVEVE